MCGRLRSNWLLSRYFVCPKRERFVSRMCEIPDSLGGQDTRLSPVRPGFNSRSGNFLFAGSGVQVFHNMITLAEPIPVGVVGNIRACHARARGSIPRSGVLPFW